MGCKCAHLCMMNDGMGMGEVSMVDGDGQNRKSEGESVLVKFVHGVTVGEVSF